MLLVTHPISCYTANAKDGEANYRVIAYHFSGTTHHFLVTLTSDYILCTL